MSDSYFLFTVGNTNLDVSRDQAVTIAKSYVKSLTWTIEGHQVSGFSVVDPPLSVQLVPHSSRLTKEVCRLLRGAWHST